MHSLFWPTFNVLALSAILFYYLRQPTKSYVKSRQASIETNLKEAYDFKLKTEAQWLELNQRVSRLTQDVNGILADAKKEAEIVAHEIQRKAVDLSVQIKRDTESSVAGSIDQLKREVVTELGLALIEKVETQVRSRLTQQDRQLLQAAVSKQLGGSV